MIFFSQGLKHTPIVASSPKMQAWLQQFVKLFSIQGVPLEAHMVRVSVVVTVEVKVDVYVVKLVGVVVHRKITVFTIVVNSQFLFILSLFPLFLFLKGGLKTVVVVVVVMVIKDVVDVTVVVIVRAGQLEGLIVVWL